MKIGLGTAQFGLSYGVTNETGKVPSDVVSQILNEASQARIRVLDTASGYGDSEHLLGENFRSNQNFHIITKTPHFNGDIISDADLETVRHTLQLSLKNLRQPFIYGLLVHRGEDLLKENAEKLYNELIHFKEEGLVQKIGVSVYSLEEAEAIWKRFSLDLVQVPLNIFDQRAVRSGLLQWLKSKGVEIHTRSVFLQGILLAAPETLPNFFEKVRTKIHEFHQCAKSYDLSPLEASIGFAQGFKNVDTVLCGVAGICQYEELIQAAKKKVNPEWFEEFSSNDLDILEPSRWEI